MKLLILTVLLMCSGCSSLAALMRLVPRLASELPGALAQCEDAKDRERQIRCAEDLLDVLDTLEYLDPSTAEVRRKAEALAR